MPRAVASAWPTKAGHSGPSARCGGRWQAAELHPVWCWCPDRPPGVLDPRPLSPNAEGMVSDAVDELRSRRLLTLGRVDRLLVQVGYRATPDGPAHEQFLLDLAVPEGPGAEPVALTEADILATLDPVLLVGSEAPRHYSLHQHRWHTSWGASPGALELGLLVTTEARTTMLSAAALDRVTVAFRDVLDK